MIRKVINLKEGSKLTCGARARSVGAREVVERGSGVGRWANRRRNAEGRSARAMTSRGERDDVGRRVVASGAESGWSGPVQGDLGRSGPGWESWAGLDRFGAGLDRFGPVRWAWADGAGLGRSGWPGPFRAWAVWSGPAGSTLGPG